GGGGRGGPPPRPGARGPAGAAGAPPAVAAPAPRPFRVIGTRVAKLDAIEKVTGTVQYLPDFEVPGTVWGKILRTRVPHARIVRLDTSSANALPGVLGVVTGQNIGPRRLADAKDHLARQRAVVACLRDTDASVVSAT